MDEREKAAAFREWLESLDEELRRDVPHDLASLTDEQLENCEACKRFLESFRRTVELCRATPRPAVDRESLARAAEAAREELRRKGLL
ncbi:MAG: hypothetical protein Kow0062_14230 [Acidobacteriota bacterium]